MNRSRFTPELHHFHKLDSLLATHSKSGNDENNDYASFDVTNPEKSAIDIQLKPFPFNPNMLAEEDWRRMGLSERQIKNIKNYEAKGGKFFRNEDLKKIFSISKTEYEVLEPFIRIPPSESSRTANSTIGKQFQREKPEADPIVKPIAIINLNEADSLQLIELPGVGPWFAHRILKYRLALGGFATKSQLLEVQGIDSLRFRQLESFVNIDSTLIRKININRFSIKELIQHPYINYELAKNIINYRETRGFVNSPADLKFIKGLHPEKMGQLRPYLNYD